MQEPRWIPAVFPHGPCIARAGYWRLPSAVAAQIGSLDRAARNSRPLRLQHGRRKVRRGTYVHVCVCVCVDIYIYITLVSYSCTLRREALLDFSIPCFGTHRSYLTPSFGLKAPLREALRPQQIQAPAYEK